MNSNKIIILGNQKAGTCAIACLISIASNIKATIDIPGLAKDESIQKLFRKEINFNTFINNNADDFSNKIIKSPSLTFIFDLVYKEYPKAKYIFIVRDPRENIRSILNRLKIDGKQESISESIYNNIPDGWLPHVFPNWLNFEGDNYIELMSQKWSYAANIYLNNKDKFILAKYEDFCQDKKNYIHGILKKLKLKIKNDIGDKVDVQYNIKGKKIRPIDFFGEKNLSLINNTCKREMAKLGYK